MKIAVVIPALNEAARIGATVGPLRGEDGVESVTVVDGGSGDGTPEAARAAGARVIACGRGRGRQMNAGARAAGGEALLFLHADCRLDPGWPGALTRAVERGWLGGCFHQRIDAPGPVLAVIGGLAHARARVLRVFYGDQGLWVRRDAFERLGGFREELPFLEDVEFSRRLRRAGPAGVVAAGIRSSPRDWQRHGWWRVVLRNWGIALAFAAGLPATRLARWYAPLRERAEPRA